MTQSTATLSDPLSLRAIEHHDEGREAARGAQQPDLATLSDEALMERVRGDDEEAYRRLVERHVRHMHKLALRILQDHAQAEDAVQDAFLQVWIKRSAWRDEGARFATWLYRVVFNRCLDVKRRRREEELKEGEEQPDESADAVAAIHHGQIVTRLRSAMSELPETQYLALMMYYHDGYTAREVADLLDTSTNAVESLLKRGRKNLRQYLKRLKVDAQQAFNEP